MDEKKHLTHVDESGLPGMVDISTKKDSVRIAKASGRIHLGGSIMTALSEAGYSNKKGSIIQTAIIAATMAVKRTHDTIPFCHQIPIASCKVNITPDEKGFGITCRVKTAGKTGVEMEALCGVSAAALTIYDMCKALTHDMVISEIRLENKTGGKSDYKR